ncbi:MAG: hypothetical protein KIT84_34190 [Labilithrix sp.]|nr:hypothetical protein [Labilithrix sp.]MCW5816097.1 hypothetical protein [Labilithrix sp.]
MNVATPLPSYRFNSLVVEGDKPLGLENVLKEEGCAIRRATSRAGAIEAIAGSDLIVISAAALSEDDVVELVGKGVMGGSVLVVGGSADLGLKVARLGASIVGANTELAAIQVKQMLSILDLKRKVARKDTSSLSSLAASPNSGVVQRRSAPLPKEATPDALEALIEAAEALVPMHKFQRVYVDYALRRFGGNKVHTAAALGIDRRTIQRWARARAEQRPVAATTTTTASS